MKSLKVFFPDGDFSFNERLVFALLAEGSRYKRAVRNTDIVNRLECKSETAASCLKKLAAQGLAEPTKDGWTAIRPPDGTFATKLLSDPELCYFRRGYQMHWSQLLQFVNVCFRPDLTRQEAAIWCLAYDFARRKRTFKRNTFRTMLGIAYDTIVKAEASLLNFGLADLANCRVLQPPPTHRRKPEKQNLPPGVVPFSDAHRDHEVLQAKVAVLQEFNAWLETVPLQDLNAFAASVKAPPWMAKSKLKCIFFDEGTDAVKEALAAVKGS